MKTYYDTGIFIKLYTTEPESTSVANFVKTRAKPLFITELHIAESHSALRLKEYRRECTRQNASDALEMLEHDLRSGALQLVDVDWIAVWQECARLTDQFSGQLGIRTLDTLHVSIARLVGFKEFVTSDSKQSKLAKLSGFVVTNPVAP